MGCNYLAASLVKNWTFVTKNKEIVVKTTKESFDKQSVNKLIAEPTSTARVRPSLFDRFDNNTNSQTTIPNLVNTSGQKVNSLLDDFMGPPTPISSDDSTKNILHEFSNQTQPKSMLDEFMSQGQPKNMLDDFMNPGNATTPPNSSRKVINKTKKSKPKKVNIAPKNLLDDFM